MHAERFDALVTFAGCDKSLPGMMMAAARLDLPAVFLYGGSILPGQHNGQALDIVSVFEAVGAHATGAIDDAELLAIERNACPTEGACAGMFTANTMASIAEALGMSLPGSSSPPAVDRRRDDLAYESGRAIIGLLEKGIRAAADPHQGGLRERHRRHHGPRRLHQRRAAPAGHRRGGAGRPGARRLQPHRRPGAAHRRHQAPREVPHGRRRPHRRRAGRDARAPRGRPAPRRLPHGHRQDRRREPRGHRPAAARRRGRPPADRSAARGRRPGGAHGLAGAEGVGREGGRHRLRLVRRAGPRVRRRGRGHGGDPRRGDRAGRCARHPVRGPEGRPGHAGDAGHHGRPEGRGPWRRHRPRDRRPVLRRHPRVLRRPRRSRGGRRRPDRLRRARAIASASTRSRTRSTSTCPPREIEARKTDWKLPEPRYTSGVLAKYAKLAQGAERGAITEP